MKFPTLHCRCSNNHTWGTLIPTHWFLLTDLTCPKCSEPAYAMKAGDWKDLEEVKKSQEKTTSR